jgi:hypothetical protein
MMDQAKAEEDRSVRMPRGREEAGESYSTLMPGTPGLLLTMDDMLKLPRYELVTQFKCIEGWSEIVHWAGVRMRDFLEAYPPAPVDGREPKLRLHGDSRRRLLHWLRLWESAAIRRHCWSRK